MDMHQGSLILGRLNSCTSSDCLRILGLHVGRPTPRTHTPHRPTQFPERHNHLIICHKPNRGHSLRVFAQYFVVTWAALSATVPTFLMEHSKCNYVRHKCGWLSAIQSSASTGDAAVEKSAGNLAAQFVCNIFSHHCHSRSSLGERVTGICINPRRCYMGKLFCGPVGFQMLR
jgi:hypothetical protein